MSRQRPSVPARRNHNLSQTFQEALSFHNRGQLKEAKRLYQVILQHDRDHFDSLYNLSGIEIQQGRLDDALRKIHRALKRRPNSAEAQNILGFALRASDRREEAVVSFERALAIQPNFGMAHYNLAWTLRELNRPHVAIAHYEKALGVNPAHVDAHHELAMVLQSLGQLEAAVAHYDMVLAIAPDHAQAHSNRGYALRELGHLEAARSAFENAVALQPGKAEFHYSLAFSKRFGEDDPQLSSMEALARDIGSLSEEDQVRLHFALGKAYGDVEQYEPSIRHLLAGNSLKRKYLPYDEADVLGKMEQARELFNLEVMREREGLGDPSSAPVFIIGMPRSGSTLVEQILASHPKVFGSGELMDFVLAAAGLDGPEGAPDEVGADELRQMGARYVARVTAGTSGAERITDKMLANFRFAGLIHLALPNARIIHTRRDPVDTCLSCFSQLFAVGQAFTYNLAELGRYYRAYEGLMTHWRSVLPDQVMLEVQYEKVVADLEGEARRIVAHCGLEWDERCLQFHRSQRPVKTASVIQVRQPIYRSSIGRWRAYQPMLLPLLETLDIWID